MPLYFPHGPLEAADLGKLNTFQCEERRDVIIIIINMGSKKHNFYSYIACYLEIFFPFVSNVYPIV